jgi:hypothetical protein
VGKGIDLIIPNQAVIVKEPLMMGVLIHQGKLFMRPSIISRPASPRESRLLATVMGAFVYAFLVSAPVRFS